MRFGDAVPSLNSAPHWLSTCGAAPTPPPPRHFFHPTPHPPTHLQDLEHSRNASLTLHELQMVGQACRGVDPEDPTCAKLTLTGLVGC